MDDKEIMMAIASRDRCWAEIREKKDRLSELLMDQSKLKPSDLRLLLKCITLVFADITLYEKDFLAENEEEKEFLTDNSPSGSLNRMTKGISCWQIIGDEDSSSEKKLGAIKDIRKSLWGNLLYRKDELVESVEGLTSMEDNKDNFHLLFSCMSMVVVELSLKEIELKILGIDDYPEF